MIDVVVEQSCLGPATLSDARRYVAVQDHGPDVRNTGVSAQRQGLTSNELHPVVLLGVVGSRDLSAAIELVAGDRVVQHVGPEHAEVDYVCALSESTIYERCG